MRHAGSLTIGFLCLLLSGGCSAGDRAGVSGSVTLDGAPVAAGSIAFEPAEGTQGASAGAAIAQGSYEIALDKGPKPGTYLVVIHAQRKTGKKIPAGSPAPPGTFTEEVEEAIPARYNQKSTLRHELKAGTNRIDFALSSK